VTNTVNASEKDYIDVAAVEEPFEEIITEDNPKEEATTLKTTTNGSDIEVITEQTTIVESNQSSVATEKNILGEGPMLEDKTTETIPIIEAMPSQMTNTEFPNEEISTEEATTLNEDETSTITEDPVEATTEDIRSTEVQGTNEIDKSTKKEEEDVFTTNKQSTEKPTAVQDETDEVTTTETELKYFSTDILPTAVNESSPEQPRPSEPFGEEPETSTVSSKETTEELSTTEVTPEETTTFDNMVRELPSLEEVFYQDSLDVEIETNTIAFDEVVATETFTESYEAFEGKTTDTSLDTSTSDGEITTRATDFQTETPAELSITEVTTEETTAFDNTAREVHTIPGQLNKQVETLSAPVPEENTMIDVLTEKSIMEESTAPNALLEEGTTTRSTPEERTTTDEVTTPAPSTIIMTHTYVMQERKNGSLKVTDDIFNEIPVDDQSEMKGDVGSKLLDLVTQNFREADNIIFNTEEIIPVKAPEDETTERTTDDNGVTSFLNRIQEDKIRDQLDSTSYRTEKSISKVVTEISV